MKKLTLFLVFISFLSFSQTIIPLWENGAPGFESRKNEPEQAKDWWVKNIHNPSITAFFPEKSKANGTSVIIFPGGGHRELVFTAEGKDAAEYLNTLGITAFVLKYRLAREPNSPYSVEKHVRQDAYRAIRLVKSRAKEWGLDTTKIGIWGFSAGGEVAALVAYDDGKPSQDADNQVDKQNGKPNFQILVYPGPNNIPGTVPSDAPPTIAIVANDDVCCSGPVVDLLRKYREAKVPIEVHIYTKGSHGFNMGKRSNLRAIHSFPDRITDWLIDGGYSK